jgi:4-carboxymuconolactone decarboxylase
MSRIPLADLDPQSRLRNLNVLRLLANAPMIFPAWIQMVEEIFASPTFDARLREVIILRVAHLQDSPYELGQHRPMARNAGLTERQIEIICGAGDLDDAGFTPTERAALDVVTELCDTHRLADESFAAAYAVFGDEALTELLMIVSCYYGLALVLNAADPEVDA